MGRVVHDTDVDEGVSGAQEKRPALDRLLADAQAARFELLLVWKLDRLGRSLQHLLRVLSDPTSWGVGFASARDPRLDSTTPSGRLMLHLIGDFAELERAMIRERVIAGVRRAQAAGKHCGRPRVELDLRPALAMFAQGYELETTSKALEVSRATLRRRLIEAGEWPRKGGQKPHPTEIA